MARCDACKGAFVKVQMCGRCKRVKYCSRACQSKHWKAGHKAQCARWVAEAEAVQTEIDKFAAGAPAGGGGMER